MCPLPARYRPRLCKRTARRLEMVGRNDAMEYIQFVLFSCKAGNA